MSYLAYRDALLVHAKAAAIATDPTWTNVAIGLPVLNSGKGVRLFYGGEGEAPKMPMQKSLSAELVGEHVALVAWWSLGNLSDSAVGAVDTQMFTFKDSFRGLVTADQAIGGSAGVDIDYADPDVVVVGGTRYAILGFDITASYSEYPY